jgi:hypothetical protein
MDDAGKLRPATGVAHMIDGGATAVAPWNSGEHVSSWPMVYGFERGFFLRHHDKVAKSFCRPWDGSGRQ